MKGLGWEIPMDSAGAGGPSAARSVGDVPAGASVAKVYELDTKRKV